jgi:hypothetical protein
MERKKAEYRKIERAAELLNEIQLNRQDLSELLGKFQQKYQEIPREERSWLFDALLHGMEVRKADIESQVHQLLATGDEDPLRWSTALTQLRRSIESPRMRAFRRFLSVSGGIKFLLDLRADVLVAQREGSPELEVLDEELSHLFNSWFQQGFLLVQPITRDSSFRQIRFLKEHDMVHPMASLEEMGNRLGDDRCCFALYHRSMPEEPVLFIEVALTRGIARSIHDIIRDQESPGNRDTKPDTAIFYSINNTQNGLAGLGLGKVLIFQVVDAIKKDWPEIKTFASLSPIPGFWQRYLKPILVGNETSFSLTREGLLDFFPEKTVKALMERHHQAAGAELESFPDILLEILSDTEWYQDTLYTKLLQWPLRELAYHYITKEKNRQGKPINPVANFHMGNGARLSLEYINFGANHFERGLEDSCGLMANYIYSRTWLQQIGANMQGFLRRS